MKATVTIEEEGGKIFVSVAYDPPLKNFDPDEKLPTPHRVACQIVEDIHNLILQGEQTDENRSAD